MKHETFTKFREIFGILWGQPRSRFAMGDKFELNVHLACDEETGRWYIAQSDIPGLRLEADDAFKLMDRIKEAAPELIELNLGEILEECLRRNQAAQAGACVIRRGGVLPGTPPAIA
jgi:hypothetical protein